MQRAYALLAALMVGVFGYAQYHHLSLYGTDAGTKEAGRSSGSTGTRGK